MSNSISKAKYALVVDDDPGILDVYEMALSDLGFTPILTSDSRIAMEKAILYRPSVVILDQRMPGLTGIELAREIRTKLCRDTPIIIVSAGRNIEAEALAAGATVCLEKPFDVNDLIEVVLARTQSGQSMTA